jgi:hypothetical protein
MTFEGVIRGLAVDKYNNVVGGEFICRLNMEDLRFVVLAADQIWDHPSQHRVVQGLLILYWRQFWKELSAQELIDLLLLSDSLPVEGVGNSRDRRGLRAYLLTRAFSCEEGGRLREWAYRSWPHHEEFNLLLSTFC